MSIDFAIQRIAITFLVFLEQDEQLYFVGYYTLANKFVSVSGNMLSKTMQKRIARFSQYDMKLESYLNFYAINRAAWKKYWNYFIDMDYSIL